MSQSVQIDLPSLCGSSPLGALAAFGLLRVCSEIPELSDAKLSWKLEDDWYACLIVSGVPDDVGNATSNLRTWLIHKLVNRQKFRMTAKYWKGEIDPLPSEFAERLKRAAWAASCSSRDYGDYLAAFGSEAVTYQSKKNVKPTAFCMTSGKQAFLSLVRELGSSLVPARSNKKTRKGKRSDVVTVFWEALLGPWSYKDDQHHLGFDPSSEKLYALRHKKPEDDKKNRSVRAAVWLAIESLPLFPTVSRGSRLDTGAFSIHEGEEVLRWPVWEYPISFDTLRSLLLLRELHRGESTKIGLWGIAAVFQSVRSVSDKGYGVFRPATVIWLR